MKDRCFLDTNIFICAIDTSPELKEQQAVARHLINEHIRRETGVISIQVLQEFYQVSTHKIQLPPPWIDCRKESGNFWRASPVQVYLELMTGDKRDRETAEQVKSYILNNLANE